VLSDVSFVLEEGTVTAVLGADGAGKSTLLRAIAGVADGLRIEGTVTFAGRRIDRLATERVVRTGVAYVPEGRRVYAELTVAENLRVGAYVLNDRVQVRRSLERVHERFPILRERQTQRAGTLSGGEQQVLAIARALMSSPRLLLLDEPSTGLSPILVRAVLDLVGELRDEGVTVLLAEQSTRAALSVADRAIVLEGGRVLASGTPAELVDRRAVEALYMGAPAPPPPSVHATPAGPAALPTPEGRRAPPAPTPSTTPDDPGAV
jgi:branched-chain amino acid transport system ATP-binding protein